MIKKTITQIFIGVSIMVGLTYTSFAQSTQPTTPPPTPSMQEQYDKLHGVKPKTTTKEPVKKTTKPQTTQKPAKAAPAPKPEVVKVPSSDEGGFKFKVGLRGGANYCTFSVPTASPSLKIDPILGYHGGLILSLGGEKFSVQPEILYSQIGGKSNTTLGGTSVEGKTIVNTVTVPILLKVALGSDKFKFFINAGGYGSYALNGKATSNINGSSSSIDIKFTKDDARLEYGAVGGAGISLGLGGAQLLIEGRYYYGLGNNNDVGKDNKSFVRNIQGSIGLLFPLGGK